MEDYSKLTDTDLRKYLDSKAEESKKNLTATDVDIIVDKDLHMDMSIRSARSRMELLFMNYTAILRRNGLKWVLQSNQKLAVQHVLSAIKPQALRKRLESDLEFAHSEVRKDFKKFMAHALSISDAFEIVDNGPSPNRVQGTKSKPSRGGSGGSGKITAIAPTSQEVTTTENRIPTMAKIPNTEVRSAKHRHALSHLAKVRERGTGSMIARNLPIWKSGK